MGKVTTHARKNIGENQLKKKQYMQRMCGKILLSMQECEVE